MAAVFADVVFDGWTRRELERVELPDAPPALLPALDDAPGATGELPPAAAALFLVAWGRMHGMVSLEAFGHTAWLGAAGADLFDAAMRLLVDDMERLRTGA
jgi:hypothetical protein